MCFLPLANKVEGRYCFHLCMSGGLSHVIVTHEACTAHPTVKPSPLCPSDMGPHFTEPSGMRLLSAAPRHLVATVWSRPTGMCSYFNWVVSKRNLHARMMMHFASTQDWETNKSAERGCELQWLQLWSKCFQLRHEYRTWTCRHSNMKIITFFFLFIYGKILKF